MSSEKIPGRKYEYREISLQADFVSSGDVQVCLHVGWHGVVG